MKLYGIWLKARYECFDSYHTCISKKLFKTVEDAEKYMPIYKEEVVKLASEKHGGFYKFDLTLPIETTIIDFKVDL